MEHVYNSILKKKLSPKTQVLKEKSHTDLLTLSCHIPSVAHNGINIITADISNKILYYILIDDL